MAGCSPSGQFHNRLSAWFFYLDLGDLEDVAVRRLVNSEFDRTSANAMLVHSKERWCKKMQAKILAGDECPRTSTTIAALRFRPAATVKNEGQMSRYLAVAAALIGFATPALSQPKEDTPCLRASQIDDFKGLPGGGALIVTDNFRKKFKITLQQRCDFLQSNPTLVFKARAPGSLACLTRGDIVLSGGYGGPPDRCIIQKIEVYSPQAARPDSSRKN